jgi:death-on-curing protein
VNEGSVDKLIFLNTKDLLDIHEFVINRYGGASGTRDLNLLDSAASQPKATFDGIFVHKDIYEMAAAYFFHIIKNHAFVDGNKRTGVACTNTFLILNGYEINLTGPQLYKIAINVAASITSKADLIKLFKKHITKKLQN